MRFIILSFMALAISGCGSCSSKGRVNSTWERFLKNEKEVAKISNASVRRSWSRQVNNESWSDDWNRIGAPEINIVTSPEIGRDSTSRRFLNIEKEHARYYSEETTERIANMGTGDGFKPYLSRFFEQETAYRVYSTTEQPYRSEHEYTRASTFGKIVADDKEIAADTTDYIRSIGDGFSKDIDDFGPSFKKSFDKLFCPLDI